MALMPPSTGGLGLVVATAESTNPPTRATTTSAGIGSASGTQYTQANQYNQANSYQQLTVINPGYTVDQVRGELSEFIREAERRHLAASRYQAEASEMRVDNLEQQAMKNHYEVVGRLESNISKIEVRAADRDKFLVSELQSLQEQNMAMQRDHAGNVAIAEAIQAQRLQTVYSNEMVEFRRSNSEFLSEQFSEQFSKFKLEESLRMSLTEDQMQAQNDELQEELVSAEKALKFYRETANATDIPVPSTPLSKASGYTGLLTPPGISAPQGPQAPSPHVIPDSMRGLFAQMNVGSPTMAEAKGAPSFAQPAETPRSTTGPQVPVGNPSEGAPNPTLEFLKAQTALLEAAGLLKGESAQEEKPKAKEAETVKLPDFPNPETYRSWKTATRESIRAASDKPDEAFKWILEVYDKGASHEALRDPQKFLTLDTKLLAALTKVAKGELARQILNFKEVEAGKGRAVRGRQILYLFDQYFKTNEEVGSLYSVEDLLKVNLLGDDLSSFIHNWESVIAGMSHVPDEVTQRDILLRQIRKSTKMKYDLEIYDRAKEGSKEHSYGFLVQSIKDLLTRERMGKNRDRIAKSHGDKYGAPAPTKPGGGNTRPPSRGGRGRSSSRDSGRSSVRSRSSSRSSSPKSSKAICYDFQKGKCTRGDKCKYLHKARSQSPKTDKPNKGGKKINAVCTFWKKGKCTRGDKCRFLHCEPSNNPSASETAAPAPSEKPEKPRSPSPAPPRRRGSRGRSKSREQKPAACCILAAAAPEGPKPVAEDGDYWEVDFKKGLAIRHHVVYRKQWFIPDETCPVGLSKLKGLVRVERVLPVHPLSSVEEWSWRVKVPKAPDTPWVGQSIFKIRKEVGKPQFKEWPQIRKIPIEGTGKHISTRPRRFSTCYADEENCPKADPRDARFAVEAAKELKGIVDCINSGVVPPCKFECEEEDITCEHCADVCKPACPSRLVGVEFLADTGSEEDLISQYDQQSFFPEASVVDATKPVSLITANGPVLGDKSVNLTIPELGQSLECYVLENTPPVCSVGRRCMDEGFDFHWYAGKPPYFVTPDGKKLRCKMKGRVPVIGEGSVAMPAAENAKVAGNQVFSVQGGEGQTGPGFQ